MDHLTSLSASIYSATQLTETFLDFISTETSRVNTTVNAICAFLIPSASATTLGSLVCELFEIMTL